jgi:hypothetical protein
VGDQLEGEEYGENVCGERLYIGGACRWGL